MPFLKENDYGTDVEILKDIRSLLNTSRSAFGDWVAEGLRIQSGWSFPYNLDPVFVNVIVANNGTVVHDGSFAKLSTGTNPAGKAEIVTKRALAYTPGIGAMAAFTAVFDDPQPNSKQLIGIGNDEDGWFFGYDGEDFGIVVVNKGVWKWYYQKDWNIDERTCLDPQMGNVYRIDFQWLGFGAQYFSIEDREGNIRPVHRIDYSNKNTDVSVQNPSLPVKAIVVNEGNTAELILKTPSAIAGSYGQIDSSAFEFPVAFDQLSKPIEANTETYLFSIRNPDQFLGKSNRLYTLPAIYSFSSSGTKDVVIRFYFNAVPTGPVAWVDLAAGITPLQYDITGTGRTGGLKVLTLTLGSVDRDRIDLTPLRGLISPGSSLTVTALSKNASEITSGFTFKSRI